MVVVLAAAGAMAFGAAFPIYIAIVVLLAIVTLSYEQTIHAYPKGGGSYIVARDNLGDVPARAGHSSLPNPDNRVSTGDLLHLSATREAAKTLREQLEKEQEG